MTRRGGGSWTTPMPLKPIEFGPRSIEEARAARRWYARRNPTAAERFLEELAGAFQRIGMSPGTWPAHLYGTRAVQLDRFPYLVVYQERDDEIRIVAVAHT